MVNILELVINKNSFILNNKIYFVEINETINKNSFIKYNRLISIEKQYRLLNMKSDMNKKLSLYADLFVRYIICQTFKIKNSELQFVLNKYGKPYLNNNFGLYFNISHSHNAIVVVVSNRPVGVDVEKIVKTNLKIVQRFFDEDEQNYIFSKDFDRDIRFYEVWTKKEAYMKYLGKGLHIPLNSFSVINKIIKNFFKTYRINKYQISVCSENNFFNDIIILTEDYLNKCLYELYYDNNTIND